jgi:indolepyruvate ferredoxin oxidoreductase alpha subunit
VPLCEDCPYRPAFDALEAAMARHGGRSRFLTVGETGCMVRAIGRGLFDVKYSLGSSLGVALGLAASGVGRRVIALLGDSCFFHSEMNALSLLTSGDPNIAVLILDNGSTALTGGQPHPGTARDARRGERAAADIPALVRAHGLSCDEVSVSSPDALAAALDRAVAADAPAVLVLRGACPRYTGERGDAL